MQKRICVIGAGPSGITALKNLKDKGLDVICYDRNNEVGGNWIYSEDESHSSVFETTHIISSKTLSQYEDFTFDDFDKTVADYPSHDELRRYFQAYAKKFDLYQYIMFQTSIKHCKRIKSNEWQVTSISNGVEKKEVFTDLVVCNGHHSVPRIPQYPGEFTGQFIHSHNYKKAAPYADKKVLVIGGGNSACDVAVETSRVSKKTSISWRRGYRIIPKFFFGLPSDLVGSRSSWLPIKIRSWLNDRLLNILLGKNKLYGLQDVKTKFGETHPTINDELLYKIRHGKVHPKVDIKKLENNTVHFTDNTQEEFDVIIACTGYVLKHTFFEKSFIDYSQGPVPLYLKMFHPDYHDLFFIGMFQPLGCIWPGSELQSKILANYLVDQWKMPTNIKKLCEREVTHPHYKQIDTPRHTITVDYHNFRKSLLKQLPKKWKSKQVKFYEQTLHD
ncbi:flavin-containing monooxygenase [Aquimarina sp. 2201CG5-10]|uniref:flavin-containing monooxygenase n=1 Tax=Aquimarina callyspongiae TaxID=3098150 RepID=UPI002AB395A3|nr:NAD(P)-binding domain-containing protein [Aquimarina sp. 2201CG5-10]MDY8134099.1 NAD(P)-binding domain-containing protein [Aquimarina sp. 2201CG5-10]